MLNANQKKAIAGLFAASLTVAMAPMPGADAPAPAHFINDQGELMTVDPPEANRQPMFVSIPVSGERAQPASAQAQSAKPGR
jgi:hypothetical protein